jgi:ferredoxin-NADP reductase
MQEGNRYQQYKISNIQYETTDAKTFELVPVSGSTLSYKPGQFITLSFTKPNGEDRRSYSIMSTPALNEPLAITIKRVENGEYSRYFIDHAKMGDLVQVAGVGGLFTLPDNIDDYKQVFFIVAGSGITPAFSLLKTLLYEVPHIHITLIYSNRSSASTIFYRQLIRLAEQFKERLKIDFLFSSSNNLLKARLNNSLLTSMLHDFSKAAFDQTLCYICGPVEYMDTVSITLLTEGVPAANIRKENYSAFKPEIEHQPDDQEPHVVTLQMGQHERRILVQYPQSILDAALEQKIRLPYSCRSGQCGSCTAICTHGSVWMAYNEVLTEQDLQKGLILTCQGFPINGDVTITI